MFHKVPLCIIYDRLYVGISNTGSESKSADFET